MQEGLSARGAEPQDAGLLAGSLPLLACILRDKGEAACVLGEEKAVYVQPCDISQHFSALYLRSLTHILRLGSSVLKHCHHCRVLSPTSCAYPTEAHQPSVENATNTQHVTSDRIGMHAAAGQQRF